MRECHKSGSWIRSNKARGRACVRMNEWMNESFMCMMLQYGRCVSTRELLSTTGFPVPPLVTFTQRPLLTLVRLTLSHSGRAKPNSRSLQGGKSLPSSSPAAKHPDLGYSNPTLHWGHHCSSVSQRGHLNFILWCGKLKLSLKTCSICKNSKAHNFGLLWFTNQSWYTQT